MAFSKTVAYYKRTLKLSAKFFTTAGEKGQHASSLEEQYPGISVTVKNFVLGGEGSFKYRNDPTCKWVFLEGRKMIRDIQIFVCDVFDTDIALEAVRLLLRSLGIRSTRSRKNLSKPHANFRLHYSQIK